MNLMSIVGFIFIIGCAECGTNTILERTNRIINGSDAKFKQIPYQVSLQRKNGIHFCGGAIISPVFILTAAHCTQKDKIKVENIIAVVGTIFLTQYSPSRREYSLKKVFNHPLYQRDDFGVSHDISLIVIKEVIEFSDFIQKIELPKSDPSHLSTTMQLISGWGLYSNQNQAQSETLQYMNTTMYSFEHCKIFRERFERDVLKLNPGNICTFREDACISSGDSGIFGIVL